MVALTKEAIFTYSILTTYLPPKSENKSREQGVWGLKKIIGGAADFQMNTLKTSVSMGKENTFLTKLSLTIITSTARG